MISDTRFDEGVVWGLVGSQNWAWRNLTEVTTHDEIQIPRLKTCYPLLVVKHRKLLRSYRSDNCRATWSWVSTDPKLTIQIFWIFLATPSNSHILYVISRTRKIAPRTCVEPSMVTAKIPPFALARQSSGLSLHRAYYGNRIPSIHQASVGDLPLVVKAFLLSHIDSFFWKILLSDIQLQVSPYKPYLYNPAKLKMDCW